MTQLRTGSSTRRSARSNLIARAFVITLLADVPVAQQLGEPGGRVLGYLHARGEALQITSPQPIKAVYITDVDSAYTSPQDMIRGIADQGFNVIIASTLQPSASGSDQTIGFCYAWRQVQLTTGQASSAAATAYIHARGAVLVALAGGQSEYPYSSDASAYGQRAASWAQANLFDGVDFAFRNIGESGDCAL